jgi:hypothetical protein
MLALRTGWTPDVLAELPDAFRAGCHWALYAEAVCGPDGLPSVDIPASAPYAQKVELQKARVEIVKLRDSLYPEDADG